MTAVDEYVLVNTGGGGSFYARCEDVNSIDAGYFPLDSSVRRYLGCSYYAVGHESAPYRVVPLAKHFTGVVFEVGRPRHKLGAQVDIAVKQMEKCGWMIGDDDAATIASWYSSPGAVGMAFTALATAGSVVVCDLLEAISYVQALARKEMERDPLEHMLGRTARWLDALAHWAITHPSQRAVAPSNDSPPAGGEEDNPEGGSA